MWLQERSLQVQSYALPIQMSESCLQLHLFCANPFCTPFLFVPAPIILSRSRQNGDLYATSISRHCHQLQPSQPKTILTANTMSFWHSSGTCQRAFWQAITQQARTGSPARCERPQFYPKKDSFSKKKVESFENKKLPCSG